MNRCFDVDFCSVAWQVNFNLKVTSFEGDLQGLRNLLDLAVSSPYTVPPKLKKASYGGVNAPRIILKIYALERDLAIF